MNRRTYLTTISSIAIGTAGAGCASNGEQEKPTEELATSVKSQAERNRHDEPNGVVRIGEKTYAAIESVVRTDTLSAVGTGGEFEIAGSESYAVVEIELMFEGEAVRDPAPADRWEWVQSYEISKSSIISRDDVSQISFETSSGTDQVPVYPGPESSFGALVFPVRADAAGSAVWVLDESNEHPIGVWEVHFDLEE